MESFTVKIVTPRKVDGCYVDVRETTNGRLNVVLRSHFGDQSEVLDSGIIEKSELFEWISNRRDY